MLAARHRLRRSEDFGRAVRRGSRVARSTVVVHLWRDPDGLVGQDSPRVGFVVGRSVGDAVTRNTVTRRLRHLMRDRVGLLPAGSVVVVRATPRSPAASSAQLGRDLDACLHSLRLSATKAEVAAR